MEDAEIVGLYFARSEEAVAESSRKYGGYCLMIARSILESREDGEECVNDTWLRAWNSIPPTRPRSLRAFFGRITRNLSLDRFDRMRAERRGGGQAALALEELSECVPASGGALEAVEERELAALIDAFLEKLPKERRVMFVKRYWELSPVREIASAMGCSEGRVRTALFRLRRELGALLQKEGYII